MKSTLLSPLFVLVLLACGAPFTVSQESDIATLSPEAGAELGETGADRELAETNPDGGARITRTRPDPQQGTDAELAAERLEMRDGGLSDKDAGSIALADVQPANALDAALPTDAAPPALDAALGCSSPPTFHAGGQCGCESPPTYSCFPKGTVCGSCPATVDANANGLYRDAAGWVDAGSLTSRCGLNYCLVGMPCEYQGANGGPFIGSVISCP